MDINNISDESLIEGCCNNNRKMQEVLYRKFAGEMYAICLAYEPDRDMAKDILQESFIKVFKSIGQYNSKGALRVWIRRIITNTAIDHYRKKTSAVGYIDVEAIADEVRDDEEVDVMGYRDVDVLSLVYRLPTGARLVFNLFAIEGLSHKEIALKLNISEGTSKSQYSRARHLLQKWVKNKG